MIKSGRLRYDSIEKLIRKYYKRAEKQESMAAMVYGKINNLPRISEMLRTESVLYLYDITANPELQLKTDYLLVAQQQDVVLQLGIIKAVKSKEQICHCNSFMVDYKKDEDYDLHYRNLTHCYEISKIVREEKETKRAEVIYQSMEAEQREKSGIEKMLAAEGIHADKKLLMKKGAIERSEPNFMCHTLIPKEEVQEADELINKIYDGSADKLFAALLSRKKLSAEQIERLKQIVADME